MDYGVRFGGILHWRVISKPYSVQTLGMHGETPGLGAEISTAIFQDQFPGKTIFDDGYNFKSIKVVKGGVVTLPQSEQIHGVDGISGGTITSNAVDEMIKDCLENYVPYIKKNI